MKLPVGRFSASIAIEEVKNVGRTKLHSLILPSRRLLAVGSVCWIISGLYFREPFQAGGVDLCDPVLEGGAPSRYRRMPSRVTSCPFWRVLANFERFLQAKTRCHSVRVS
jgi:hypothetical protein